jgi:transcriptional regulator with XRE-family HTH domain
MKISGAQVKAARELLKITQPELAKASDVSERTLRTFETDEDIPKPGTLDKIVGELQRRGIEFTNGTGIGVRLNFEKAAEFARMTQPRKESDG